MTTFALNETVATVKAIPAHRLRAGQVGVVVDVYRDGEYEVEFCDEDGATLACVALRGDDLTLQYSAI